jgi:hypothetical protein
VNIPIARYSQCAAEAAPGSPDAADGLIATGDRREIGAVERVQTPDILTDCEEGEVARHCDDGSKIIDCTAVELKAPSQYLFHLLAIPQEQGARPIDLIAQEEHCS